MVTRYHTPGVYVEETPVFPSAAREVESALPAFVGYTAQATKDGVDLHDQVIRIRNLAEFEQYFGGSDAPAIDVALWTDAAGFHAKVSVAQSRSMLYHAVRLFFDNGGGDCYVTSVGSHAEPLSLTALMRGLDAVQNVDEVTLLVCPDAVCLSLSEFGVLSRAMLLQCGKLQDRFAILDTFGGDGGEVVAVARINRVEVGNANLKYGAMYYPWLRTSYSHTLLNDGSNVQVTIDQNVAVALSELRITNSGAYDAALSAVRKQCLVMPPSGAITGVYAATDRTRGVWKAPANISLNNVLEPLVKLDNAHQDELSTDVIEGKSINVIRAFDGEGTRVWGARTLAGNDNEWRYVSVRRFFNMVEESLKKSICWAVFEPNDANTWIKVRGMIENYLTQKWREGALAGTKPEHAFFVRRGPDDSKSPQDILELEIGMAAVRPAEFIILRFALHFRSSP